MSIHVAITRQVRAGCEAEFEEKLRRFAQKSFDHSGTRGVQILSPAPGANSREYGILRSFATESDRNAFYQSPMFKAWETEVAGLVEGTYQQHDLHGLEAWFYPAGQPHPPRWKMALATLLGVYPTSLALGTFVVPYLHGFPKPLASFIVASCMVICLTWLVMPQVTKVLHRWLQPKP